MQSLVDILDGKYNVAAQKEAPKAAAAPPQESHAQWLWEAHSRAQPQPLSLLQTSSRPHKAGNLQAQIENALHKGLDTHDLLMQIKAKFDSRNTESLDAENVKNVMSAMQDVLHSMENEQSKSQEAKQKCDEQMYRAREEEQGLKANVALMSSSQDHTLAAVKASKSNLQGIGKKMSALAKSEADFKQIVARTLQTLKDTSKDRLTILTAVRKAGEVAE